MEQLDHHYIVEEAVSERWFAQNASSGRGGRTNRENGCLEYAAKVRAFLLFMQSRDRGSVPISEFRLYQPVVASLVERGQLKREVLDQF
jgi:hypothetical protein